MKGKGKLEPTKDLLDKVIFIAETKTQLPLDARGVLNAWGVYCRVNRLPDGALFYQAGGKFVARLRFVVEVDSSITVRKYQPGDWENNLVPTYDNARFTSENLQKGKEMDELLAGARDTEEKIRRFEQRASEVPNQANYWSTISMLVGLYRDVGRFRDAEKAAISAVEAWPNQPLPHFALSYIYFVALLNAKRVKVEAANEQFIKEHGAPAAGLTLETLGYTYEQAYALAGRHLEKVLELVSPRDKGTRAMVQRKLSDLKAIDSAPGLEEFVEAVNENPDSANAWSVLSWKYMEAGKFKASEKAASTAMSLAPDNAQFHFNLSTLYYGALCNSKGTMTAEEFTRLLGTDLAERLRHKELSLFASEGQPPNELTLEALGCNYEYAHQMVETHATETIRLSKDKELTKAAKEHLATLRLMNQM